MAQIAQVDKREIHFYTEALTQLRVRDLQNIMFLTHYRLSHDWIY